jgi:F-type H+-transporting ATPase subunit alpha
MRNLSRGLRYEYVHYRSLQRLTRLRTKLSPEASQQLQRGRALYELLTQENNAPLSLAEEIILFYAFDKKILEVINIEQVKTFKAEFFAFLLKHNASIVDELNKFQDLTDQIKNKLDGAIQEFFRTLEIG